ncbi:hypothetical protein [Geothrix sp. 21YS21S-4]|uniref:hypothetical protein n=1 Tax=Geothrix sp. 21YS21S-4 TaxID=3068889 RepID=UPI0027BACF2C|nr:hypothetical protein [Geothrix sp. 21YS21S-4]
MIKFSSTILLLGIFLGSASPALAGRCTGSPSCRACRNCSRCKHCNAGGTCGVCAPHKQAKPKLRTTPPARP